MYYTHIQQHIWSRLNIRINKQTQICAIAREMTQIGKQTKRRTEN